MKNIFFSVLFLGTFVAYGQDTVVSKSQPSAKVLDSLSANALKKTPYLVEHKRSGFYFDDGSVMRMPAFAKLLTNEGLPHLWEQYSSGMQSLNAGHGFLTAGLACNVTGGVVMLTSLKKEEQDKKAALAVGSTVLLIGVVLDAVSIPLIIKGKNKTSDVISQYNAHVKRLRQETSQLTLRLGSTSCGVGLTVDF
jgi:hypothetical protein